MDDAENMDNPQAVMVFHGCTTPCALPRALRVMRAVMEEYGWPGAEILDQRRDEDRILIRHPEPVDEARWRLACDEISDRMRVHEADEILLAVVNGEPGAMVLASRYVETRCLRIVDLPQPLECAGGGEA
jgi:hypothetical protein